MFVHISPEPDALGETISTLKFAERVATVELGAARINKDSADVKELKEQVLNTLIVYSWFFILMFSFKNFESSFQIASLKAALARKEGGGESEDMQHSFLNSSEKYRTKANEFSPFHSNKLGGEMLDDQNSCRQPMGDVGNIEVNILS